MKKKLFLLVLACLLGYGVWYCWVSFPIVAGYGAKNLCSCYFVSNRSVEDILSNELGEQPLSLGTFEVFPEANYVEGSVMGFAKRRAYYRPGLGCTLLPVAYGSFPTNNLPSNRSKSVQSAYWPIGDVLQDTLPEGLNMEQLKQAVGKAFEENNPEKLQNTRAVVVVYDGRLVWEQYADGFDKNTPQIGWSMTKSITNALVGILSGMGKMDVKDKAKIADWQSAGDPRHEITLDHLMKMSSGLKWEEDYGAASEATNMLFKTTDMGAFAAQSKLAHTPGEKWYYSSGTTNIIASLVKEAIAPSAYLAFPKNMLFDKIGMYSAVMELDPSGTFVGSSYTYATPRDWARFGLLYYYDGVWFGERILPEGWVAYTKQPAAGAPKGEYGAQFWLNAGAKGNPKLRALPDVPQDMFSANGFNGQRIFIVPSKKLVVVRMGLTKRGYFDYNKFLSQIIASLP